MDTYGKAKNMEGMGGGTGSALTKNPNEHGELNDSPDGPFSHLAGMTGDGGKFGSLAVKGKGETFYFK